MCTARNTIMRRWCRSAHSSFDLAATLSPAPRYRKRRRAGDLGHDAPMSSSAAGRDLVVEPVSGWRVWRLTSVNGEVRLTAVARGSGGRCAAHGGDLSAARRGRGAGRRLHVRAVRGLDAAGARARRRPGEPARRGRRSIDMWGRVVEHDRGTRAALAYPSRLRLVCGPCLAERRGPVDPVEVVDRGEDLEPVCARHLDRRPRPPRGRGPAGAARRVRGRGPPGPTALAGLRPRRGSAAVLRRLDALPQIPERFRTAARDGGGDRDRPRARRRALHGPAARPRGRGRIAPGERRGGPCHDRPRRQRRRSEVRPTAATAAGHVWRRCGRPDPAHRVPAGSRRRVRHHQLAAGTALDVRASPRSTPGAPAARLLARRPRRDRGSRPVTAT